MKALEGVRVIDFTHVLAGPFCTYQLAVMGADVIKVEPPDNADMMRPEGVSPALAAEGRGAQYLCQNANKRAITLDLNTPRGLKIIHQLIKSADVLVQNYRFGTLGRLGLGDEALHKLNPKLIICSVTGFGRTGPKAQHPAYDNVIQAFSGMMAATGLEDVHPVKVGPPVLDYGTGAQAAFAVACALLQREKTGKGQVIDVAMLDAALMLMSTQVMDTQISGEPPAPHGNSHHERAGYSCYETADGLVMIGAFTARQNQRLWRALGLTTIADEYEGLTSEQIRARDKSDRDTLAKLMLSRTADEWEEYLNEEGVPAARVRTLEQTLAEPQVASRGLLQDAKVAPEVNVDLKVPVAAFGYASDGPEVTSAPPKQGEHCYEVLAELGYSIEDVASLKADGVI